LIELKFQTIRDRLPIIQQYVSGDRAVMDLGCVDSRPARHDAAARIEYKANLLHKRIAEINPSTLGVDIDPEGVRILNEQGFKAIVGNVEEMDLGQQFDTIIAGEIIEHLENPGRFLRNMRRHLKSNGVIIVSTPNPFYSGSAWKIWRYGQPAVHEDHMGWQDPTTMAQLFRRTGFEPFEGYWIQPSPAIVKTWKRLLRPYFSHTFMMLARPK
jgi:2-polyprenyl-3-methyl-5-hydroxy-6-metoxy-1,4-benzoquinol methylase